MDTPDQPAPNSPATPSAPEAHVNEVPIVIDDGLEWIALSGDAPPPPAQRPTEPASAPAQGGADRAPDTFADCLGVGDRPVPSPPEPPPSRSAQVTAAMAKVRTEQRRSMARRTPYGYRLGHADGPWENAKRKRLPNGRKSTEPDRRPLVENSREMEILDAIIAGFRKHADLPLGKAAHQVAKALRWHEVANPRGTAPWHSGSIKSIYKTAMAHRQKTQQQRDSI